MSKREIMEFDNFEQTSTKWEKVHHKSKKFKKSPQKGDAQEVVSTKKTSKQTLQEFTTLKETEHLYSGGLFRLQIEELIAAVKIKEKHKRYFTEWYENLRTFLQSLPNYSEVKLSSIEKIKTETQHKSVKKLSARDKFILKLSKCNTDLKCDQDLTMSFSKPENVDIFGLHKVDALPGPQLRISINLEMPKTLFNAKDYQNNRYFVKRYYYLMYIATALQDTELCSKIECVHHRGIHLLPSVQIMPKNNDKISVILLATPDEDLFKPSRFMPDKNNVKHNVFSEEFFDVDEEIMKWTQTVYYNAALLHDITFKINMSYIEEIVSNYPNIQDGIKLLCIWAKQRDLFSTSYTLNEELIVYIVVYLIQQKRFTKYLSSYQIIRTFWDFLYRNDLRENPIYISDSVSDDTLVEYQNNYDLVVLDRTGCYNVASFLIEGCYEKIKEECHLAFTLVDTSSLQAFHNLFITKLPLMLQYDIVIDINDKSKFRSVYSVIKEQEKAKYFGNYQSLIIKHIYGILKKGLNNRATLIVSHVSVDDNWQITEVSKKNYRILIGINLDADHAFNYIEHGPSMNDPREKEFREFWGPLSSDRRFKDGTACVTLYFDTKTIKDRREIIKWIINYLVKDKLKLCYKSCYNEIESMLTISNIVASYELGTNEEPTLKAIQVSDNLAKKLRELDMSLTITGVQGISSLFSYTDCCPPIQTTYRCGKTVTKSLGDIIVLNEKKLSVVPKFVKPVECVIQLERSSKWPDDLQAVKYTKTAFFLEIAKQFQDKSQMITSVKHDFIDVFSEGLVFRYKLYVPKEINLLKKVIDDDGIVAYKETVESVHLEKTLEILPQIRSALKGLHSQNGTYGPSSALIKKWLRAHLLDNFHFPSIVLELLNASVYVNSSPFMPAQTPQIAFFRFLKFFSELEWDLEPVVINFNDTLIKEEINEIESSFQKNRNAYPPLCLVIPYDKGQSSFTKAAPTKEVLFRVKKLAQASLQLFEGFINTHTFSFSNLFIPNMEGYNLLIHMKPLLNSRRHEQMKVDCLKKLTLEAYNPKESQKMPIVDFNPVDIYLNKLRENYGKFASFFHNSYGGNVIAILWKPEIFKEKEFKITSICGRKLVDDKLVVNIDGLVDDFHALGKDIVKSIEINK